MSRVRVFTPIPSLRKYLEEFDLIHELFEALVGCKALEFSAVYWHLSAISNESLLWVPTKTENILCFQGLSSFTYISLSFCSLGTTCDNLCSAFPCLSSGSAIDSLKLLV